MTDRTVKHSLPYILPAQAQKHVTHNEALKQIDQLLQASVVSVLNDAPQNPSEGDCYLVSSSPSGDWANLANRIVMFVDGTWNPIAPTNGMRVWNSDSEKLMVFDSVAWRELENTGNLNPVDLVGVASTADQTNRLTVSSDASLFSHNGTDHRLKINKSASGDVASLLFQSDYSGRAEIGLAGDDDLRIKVSADGTSWIDAIHVDASTGSVSLPNTSQGANSSNGGNPGGQNLQMQFNDDGTLGGAESLVYDSTSNRLSVSGKLAIADTAGSDEGVFEFGGQRFIHTFGANNTFVGKQSGNFGMTTANNNAAMGTSALQNLSTGVRNLAFGASALWLLTSGSNNVAVGDSCLSRVQTGSNNVGIGNSVMANPSGAGISYNVGIGFLALQALVSGQYNTVIGSFAGQSVSSGGFNVLTGRQAGKDITTGSHNLCIGTESGHGIATGSYNLVLGKAQNLPSDMSNHVLLSDGAGNRRLTVDDKGHSQFEGLIAPKSFMVSELPSAPSVGAGMIAFVPDEAGGAVLAFSDGVNWLRSTDRTPVT